ncbi:MAG: hypothetical protein GY859_07690 [Desulfobacterales bacterium]|nr:hypothetical protein [Desulfobacterales bacterium]
MVGRRVGVKNTLEKNYLHLTEGNGAQIIPDTEVTGVRPWNDSHEIFSRKTTAAALENGGVDHGCSADADRRKISQARLQAALAAGGYPKKFISESRYSANSWKNGLYFPTLSANFSDSSRVGDLFG